jgi:hypothetical protein
MSLSALTWRQLPTQTIAVGSTAISAYLDAIYAAFGSSTYADGTARSAGSGLAWSVSRYQVSSTTEAVYLLPVSSDLNQRVAFAGASVVTSYTPTMMTGNTKVADMLYTGLSKNTTGIAANWYGNSGAPFSGGSFSGYAAVSSRSASYNTTLRCYESQDAIMVVFEQNSSVVGMAAVGAFIDPESTDTTNDAESDGKLYGLSVGTSFSWSTAVSSVGATVGLNYNAMFASPLIASPTNAYSKMAIFAPGGSSLLLCTPMSAGYCSNSIKSRNLKNIKFPILLGLYNTYGTSYGTLNTPASTFVGRLREMWVTARAANGTKFSNGGSDVGYVISSTSANNSYDSLLLTK